MAYKYPTYPQNAGLRNVGSYQISGHPYLTGNILARGQEHKIVFPFVTKEFTVIGSGSENSVYRVHFRSTSSTANVVEKNHWVQLTPDDAVTFHVKCKEVYISALHSNHDEGESLQDGYQIVASLTMINTASMYVLENEGITE